MFNNFSGVTGKEVMASSRSEAKVYPYNFNPILPLGAEEEF